jgi:hypothetical protein
MKFLSLALIAAFGLLAGCATSPVNSTAAEKIDLTRYRAVNVAMVRFVPEVASALSVEERDSLGREFRLALMEGLPASSPAAELSPGVARIEVMVTELNASSPAVNALTTLLLFVPFDAGGVAFEARFYDGQSDEPFAQTTHRHISTPLELKGSFRRYGHATRAFRNWAEQFSSGLTAVCARSDRRRS